VAGKLGLENPSLGKRKLSPIATAKALTAPNR
jgi:hypothetical protein